MKNEIKTYLSKREFTKNILTLMTGNTIALAIPIAITPILTRIYSPEDFGILAVFMAITAITSSIVNAKYEQAIVLSKNDNNAINILTLSIGIAIIVSAFLLILIVFFDENLANLFGETSIKKWLYFIPLSTLFIGIFNGLNYYNIRKKKFKNIAISQITRFSSLGIIQIGFGIFSKNIFGLISGQVMSFFFGSLVLTKGLKKKENFNNIITKTKIKKLAIKYKKFPIFSMPAFLLESLNLNMGNLLISSLFSTTILGFYSLSQRILGIPARIIGMSLKDVYFQKATEEYQKEGNTNRIFIKTLLKLLFVSVPIFILLFFIAEPLFEIVFGKEWRIAGTYTKILIPLALFRFLYIPLSTTLNIHQKQQYSLYINSFLLLSTLLVFYFGHLNNIKFNKVLIIFSIILSLEYVIFLTLNFYISRINLNDSNKNKFI